MEQTLWGGKGWCEGQEEKNQHTGVLWAKVTSSAATGQGGLGTFRLFQCFSNALWGKISVSP